MKKNKGKMKGSLIAGISDLTKLPIDAGLGYPLMQLFGNRELLVEGTLGIDEYEENEIILAVKKRKIKITGQRLTLCSLSDENLSVTGRIEKLEFI